MDSKCESKVILSDGSHRLEFSLFLSRLSNKILS